MNLKKLLLIIAVLLFSPMTTKALNSACTTSEQNRLKTLVNETQVVYELYTQDAEDELGPYKAFRIIITGFSADFYVWNQTHGIYMEFNGNSTVSDDGYAPNQSLELPFYASNEGVCRGYLISTKIVQLPPYNVYSEDPLCVGHEKFELCQKYSPVKVSSYDEFVRRVQEYIDSLKNDGNNNPSNNDKKKVSLWDKIIDFLLTYNLYFLLPIILLGTAGIIIVEIRRRRSIL